MENKLLFKEFVYDEEALLNLYLDNEWYAYTNDKDTLFKGVKNSLDCIGVYDKDVLVALIRTVGDQETIIYVQDILVLKRYQRKGIGSKLLLMIIDKYKHVRQISLATDDTEKTRKFYESVGMVCNEDRNVIGFTVKK